MRHCLAFALCAILLATPACARYARSKLETKEAVKAAIDEHLAKRRGQLALGTMNVAVREVKFQGDRAEADVRIQIGIFSTRWNVVIGGQLFSRSLRGLTVYKMELLGPEGPFVAGFLLLLPLLLLIVLITVLPPWPEAEHHVPTK